LHSVRRQYLIFAIASSALIMAAIDQTIVSVALPTMIDELDTNLALASWTLISYQLTQTIVLPLAGPLGDRWGRKQLLLSAVVLFTAGSIGAGMSPNIYTLIGFRVVQAMGGGMFFPCAAGIVGDTFIEGRQTAVGLFVTIFQIGGVIGPNVGGVITDTLSWRGIFFINVPLSILILAAGVFLIPRSVVDDEAASKKLDLSGTAFFATATFSLLFGLTYLADHPSDFSSPVPWLSFACGAVLMAYFLRHERRTENPLIDLKLVSWRPFFACNFQQFIWSSCWNGFFNFIPYYAAIAYGMSATQGGAILTPRAFMAVVVSALSAVFIGRLGYRRPWITGIYLMAASMFLMSTMVGPLVGLGATPFLAMSIFTGIGGIAVGVAIPPSQAAYFDLRPDLMASSAGFRAMAGNSGGFFGVTMTTLLVSQFSNQEVGIQIVFAMLGCVVLLSQIWVFMVPDKSREPRAIGVEPVLAPAD
jgi:EmrB/QacA subfamily drug resistance transporter